MNILLGVDEDPRFEDVLGCLRWCARIGPGDNVRRGDSSVLIARTLPATGAA